MFSSNKKDEIVIGEEDESLSFDGKIKKARDQVNKLYVIKSKIEDEELVKDIDEVRSTSIKIIDAVEKNPNKMDKLNTFFNYYLPVVLKIIEKYDEIENQEIDTEESTTMMNNTKNIVKKVNIELKRELGTLFESEIIDTEAEVKVLENMLNSEGFGENKIKK